MTLVLALACLAALILVGSLVSVLSEWLRMRRIDKAIAAAGSLPCRACGKSFPAHSVRRIIGRPGQYCPNCRARSL